MTDNELIAEFMGAKDCQHENGVPHYFFPVKPHERTNSIRRKSSLEYHASWDWLMPVVEKISQHVYESFPDEGPNGETIIKKDCAYPRTFGMIDDEGRFMVRINRSPLCYGDTLLEATHIAVTDWIKRHNETK